MSNDDGASDELVAPRRVMGVHVVASDGYFIFTDKRQRCQSARQSSVAHEYVHARNRLLEERHSQPLRHEERGATQVHVLLFRVGMVEDGFGYFL